MQQVYEPQPSMVMIKKLIITETRDDYQDVYKRNFSLNLTHGDLGKIEELIHPTANLRNYKISEAEVVQEIPNIINMANNVNGIANIPHGWRTTRGRFILEVEMNLNGTTFVYVIQGYTDFLDVSYSGHLNPDMMFYINSVTHIHKAIHPVTKMPQSRTLGSFDIIRANGQTYIEHNGVDTEHLVRPLDVIVQMYTNDELQLANTTVNTMSTLAKDTASHKSNNNPLKYFTNTVNAFTGSKMDTQDTVVAGDILKNASVYVREYRLLENAFINQLYNITGDTNPTSFKISDLAQMDPNGVKNITVIRRSGYVTPETFNSILTTNDTATTLNPTIENKQATLISNMLPSLMSDCLLGMIEFSMTNSNLTNDIIIINGSSIIDGLDPASKFNEFKHKVDTTLFPMLSMQGQLRFECFVTCNLLGDLTVAIQYFKEYDNNPPMVYRFPLFASGVFSPVIGNEMIKNALADDFNIIFGDNFQYTQNLISGSGIPASIPNENPIYL